MHIFISPLGRLEGELNTYLTYINFKLIDIIFIEHTSYYWERKIQCILTSKIKYITKFLFRTYLILSLGAWSLCSLRFLFNRVNDLTITQSSSSQ